MGIIETKPNHILNDFCNSQCPPKKKSNLPFQAKEFDRIFDHEEEEILIRSLTGSVKVRNFRHPGGSGGSHLMDLWAPDTEMGLEVLAIHLTSNVW